MDCALCVHDAIALDFDFLSLNWRCPKRAPGIRRGTLQKMPGKALKAHPPAKLPNTEATANLRQTYYKTCVDRGGKMDPLIENNQ